MVFCAAMPQVSDNVRAAFEETRQAADGKLAERVKTVNTIGKTSSAALSEFLGMGHSCEMDAKQVVCTVMRKDQRDCLQERLVLELDEGRTVRAQRSSCELPDFLGQ